MLRRLQLLMIPALAAFFVLPATDVAAQDGGRFQVLIPYFTPVEDADDDFGKDGSKELRELISTLATHVAMEEGDIKDEVKRFDMKIEDLTCVTTRQLAAQINVPVAICASYTEDEDAKTVTLSADVWTIANGESFSVETKTYDEDDDEVAAQDIFAAFDAFNTTVRSAAICQDYFASQQYDNALRLCDESLAINPDQVATRYIRARILYEMENYPESLTELETVLEAQPFHEEALQLAGYISAVSEQDDAARDYYGRYLELNPGNATIRMQIAYDLAQAGDPVGAMDFIEVGLEVDPENVDLWEQFGGFAFTAALDIQREAAVGTENGEAALTPESAGYYRQAIDAYERVFDAKGAETPVGHLRNMVSALIQLEDLDNAISLSERALETHAQEDNLWVLYADALQRNERLDEAITALDRVREINPDHPSAALRQGNWLIQAGRLEEAVEVLTDVAAANQQQAVQAANMIFAEAYRNGTEKEDFNYAIRGLTAAKRLPNLTEDMSNQLNFWHGYSVYQIAVAEQEQQTLSTAQSSLPKFQEAVGLLEQSGGYPESVGVNLAQLLQNAATYIEIQDAIIKRGR